MGLCKCPKKKFTNQFCFEHRVNVCEYCMLDIHSKCIVQPYFVWLQNSEYQANCTICKQDLHSAECIRLYCYDVFHWSCFNELQNKIANNSSQNVHVCPKCKTSIFPPEDAASPIAIAVRKRFELCSWARKSHNLSTLSINQEDNYSQRESSRTESFSAHSESIITVKDDNSIILLDENRKKLMKPSSSSSLSLSSLPSTSTIAFNSCIFGSKYTNNRYDDKYKKKFPLRILDDQSFTLGPRTYRYGYTTRNTILLHFFQMLFNRIKRNPKLLILCLLIFILFIFVVNHSNTILETDESDDTIARHINV